MSNSAKPKSDRGRAPWQRAAPIRGGPSDGHGTPSESRGEVARESLGTRLRSLREHAGLTQTELGQAVGVGEGNVASWERNAVAPDGPMVERLAVFLGVSVVEMLTGKPLNLFIPVKARKRTIHLTAENFADHLSADYAASLVSGLAVPEHGIDYDDWLVTKLVAWVELESRRSPNVTYEISRLVAAVLLEKLARQE